MLAPPARADLCAGTAGAVKKIVRASELRMFRDALTIAQVRRATEALIGLLNRAVHENGIEWTRARIGELPMIADGGARMIADEPTPRSA